MGTPSTLTWLLSCLLREYLCVDKTGTLTTDHVTLLKHLNPQLRSSDTLLDLAYINSSMQASLIKLLQHKSGTVDLLGRSVQNRRCRLCAMLVIVGAQLDLHALAADRFSVAAVAHCVAWPPAAYCPWHPAPACLQVLYDLLLTSCCCFQLCAPNVHKSYVCWQSGPMSTSVHEASVTAPCCVQSCLPSLLDHGILTHVLERGGCSQVEQKVVKLGEVPFDFDRRRATVVVRDRSNPEAAPMMVCKVRGACLPSCRSMQQLPT